VSHTLLENLGPVEVSRRLRGPGLRLELVPFVVEVRSPFEAVAQGLLSVYGSRAVLPSGSGFADFHVAVKPVGFGARRCVFELDGQRPFTPLAAGEAFAFLEWGLNWCVTTNCHGWLITHAAVLARGNDAVVLPAPPGRGKSTLCASLMHHGWRLLSDEMALLEPDSGMLVPSPRAVSLKNASIELIARRYPDAVIGPRAHDTQKGTVAHLRVDEASVLQSRVLARPAWVVFPSYEADMALQARRPPKAQALVSLASNSFNQHVHGRRGFNAMADLVERCHVFELHYSSLDEAIAWFERLELPS
jgi:HprK-related kinase A